MKTSDKLYRCRFKVKTFEMRVKALGIKRTTEERE